MFLTELFEAGSKHVTFCFGRMNPPTIGHKQVLDTMKSQGGDMRIFVSQSQDAKKNPLDYGTKIKFIKEMFPEYAGNVVDDPSLNTVVKVASYLHDQGYNAATFVAGSDRLDDMKKLLEAYNGVEGKAHGFYKFEVLDFVSSGEREDGAEGVAGVSASGARAAAANNDFEAFKEATGAGELAKPLFAAVRKGMKIAESISEAPIEMDPTDPMDPMIHSHDKANPAKLKYRMMRAAGQIKDLAARVDKASPAEWQTMTRQFEELKMNMEQIRHALEELAKVRRKGGIRSRGIDPMIDSVEEGWKSKVAGAALAAANLLASPAQASEEPVKPITIAYVKIDGEVRKYNLGDKFATAREAEEFISGVLSKQGLQGYQLDIRHGYPKKKEVKEGYGRYWCSTDKKWKTRKGPKQSRKSK